MTPSSLAIRLRENPPQRILIIKPSAIGDVVHTLPILNLLRRQWPAAQISWLVTPVCSSLLEGHPQLDEVILFDRKAYGAGWRKPAVAAELWRFTAGLRQRQFDLVLDLQGLFRSAWLGMKTRAPVRVGFASARELAWLFYTHRVRIETDDQHAIGRYLTLAEYIGLPRGPVEFVFPTTDADRAAVTPLLPSRPFAVLLPGTNWLTKRWPVEHFAGLVPMLKERFGLEAVVAGSPADAALAERIPAPSVCGKTSLRQLVAVLERAALVVANDSGPMHIASALGRPLVTPFGPTNAVKTGPYGRMDSVVRVDIPCSPCYSRRCSHQSCLQWLKPGAVAEVAGVQLGLPRK